jgi:hypothetical protein
MSQMTMAVLVESHSSVFGRVWNRSLPGEVSARVRVWRMMLSARVTDGMAQRSVKRSLIPDCMVASWLGDERQTEGIVPTLPPEDEGE